MIKKIFTDEPEVYKTNAWMAPSYETGEEASLVIDLGCIKEINGVFLKNFHNAERDNRGTREFSVYVKEKESQTWSRVDTEPTYLDRAYSYAVNMVQFVSFNKILTLRYVKLTVDSYYGSRGGGLSFFSESETMGGSSYTSKHYTLTTTTTV